MEDGLGPLASPWAILGLPVGFCLGQGHEDPAVHGIGEAQLVGGEVVGRLVPEPEFGEGHASHLLLPDPCQEKRELALADGNRAPYAALIFQSATWVLFRSA